MTGYAQILCAHAVRSAFGLGVGLLLVTSWSPALYGQYGAWLAAGELAVAVHSALVAAPLSVLLPRAVTERERRQLLGMLSAVVAVYLAAAVALAAGGAVSIGASRVLALVLTATLVGWISRALVDALFVAEGRATALLALELAYALTGAAILVSLVVSGRALDLSSVFLTLAVAYWVGVALAFHLRPANDDLRPQFGSLPAYGPVWRSTRWTLANVLLWQAQQRSYVLLVTMLAGSAAYGRLLAAALLVAPFRIGVFAWTSYARPRMAEALGRGDRQAVLHLVRWSLVVGTLAWALYVGLVWLTWGPVRSWVLAAHEGNLAIPVGFWLAFALLYLFVEVIVCALEASLNFRSITFATAAGAAVSIPVLLAAIAGFGPNWAIAGPIAGLALTGGLLVVRLRRAVGGSHPG